MTKLDWTQDNPGRISSTRRVMELVIEDPEITIREIAIILKREKFHKLSKRSLENGRSMTHCFLKAQMVVKARAKAERRVERQKAKVVDKPAFRIVGE